MKTFLKILGAIIGVLLIAGVVAFFAWFHNPYEHTLQLDPVSVYADHGEGYVITNANIVDVESGSVNEAQNLLIRNGVIDRIFTGSVPDSIAERFTSVDATGKYIMPGLFDMHAHLNSGGLIPPDESTRLKALEQFAQYGVSTIFTLGGMGFNQEVTAELITMQKNKQLVGPKIFATGDLLTAPNGYPIDFIARLTGLSEEEIDLDEQGVVIVTPETDLDAVFSLKREMGLSGVKVMVESGLGGESDVPRLSNDLARKIVETAARYDLPVFAHTSTQADFKDAVDAGVTAIAHTISDQILTDMEPTFEKMKADSIYLVPTLSIAYLRQFTETVEILDDPFLQRYNSERTARSLKNWAIRTMMSSSWQKNAEEHKNYMLTNFQTMFKAGVPILMGADAGNPTIIPGYSAHKELEFMADAGMTNADVLRSATIDPARFLGLEDTMGSIAEGKVASFLMLDRNPLEDVRNSQSINRVMLEGYWIE
ncbi:MAG: amidohydrolase family protein [Bacteroidetes bacterium]|nr:amidohydrolase family protein [Bacteroidota bacterium]MCH8524531.1 amidohydrolase family protein [Balneolales bacterium]